MAFESREVDREALAALALFQQARAGGPDDRRFHR